MSKLFRLTAAAALALSSVLAHGQEMAPGAINRAYQKVAPAICVVNYSYEATNRSSGRVTKRNSTILGVIVSPDGLVMARGHMQVDNVEPFNVRVTVGHGDNEKEYPAVVLQKPDDVNVVFLKLQSDEKLSLPYARFSNVTPSIGMPLAIIGILGSSMDYARSVQTRIIGSIVTEPRPTYGFDQPLPQPFIGGPAVDDQGRVVGVLGYELSTGEGGDLYVRSGHPLLFPASLIKPYIDSPPPLPGTVAEDEDDAWLGVFTQPLSDDLAEYWDVPQSGGIVISTVMPGSPAAKAGIQRGDIIQSLNGVALRAKQNDEVLGFTRLVRDVGAGNEVTFKLLRNGEPMEIVAQLVERPRSASEAREYEDEVFGLTVRELTTDMRIRMNVPDDVNGVLVWRVRSGSWADIAGIRPGVLIINLGDHATPDIDAFKVAVEKTAEAKPAEVPVFCLVRQTTGFFRMQPRW